MRKKMSGRADGFTLIELIVVIAILAILSGVGGVAYSGYITAANKGVDLETIGDLIYAAQLADYADGTLFGENGSAMIAVTTEGTSAAGEAGLKEALEDAVGDLGSVWLKYDKWSGAMSGERLNYMLWTLGEEYLGYLDADGNIAEGYYAPSYAESADEMWNLVRTLVDDPANNFIVSGMSVSTTSEAMAAMANRTATKVEAEQMAAAWNLTNLSMSSTNQLGSDLPLACAACVARIEAFSEFVKSYEGTTPEDAEYIKSQINLSGSSALMSMCNPSSNPFTKCYNGTLGTDAAQKNRLKAAAQAYINGGTNSRAYSDGLIYYALMLNVDELTAYDDGTTHRDGLDPNSDDYMDTIGSYIGFAGTALSSARDTGSVKDYADMAASLDGYSGSVVVITASKSGDTLTFSVSPAAADPREQN